MRSLLKSDLRSLLTVLPAAAQVFIALFACTLTIASAQAIYSNIPSPLPPNLQSLAPEAYSYTQIGDGLVFTAGSPRTVTAVKAVLSVWSCEHGHWNIAAPNPGFCSTTPGAAFSQPITLNIYSVVPGAPPTTGALLYTTTQTFQIPYRPSSNCPTDPTAWFNPADGTCYHGLADEITFNVSLTVPDQVIVGIAYNTSDDGPTPLRPQACNSLPPPDGDNCPYDSLNVGISGNPTVGSNLDPNGAWVNWRGSFFSCQPPLTSPPAGGGETTVFQDDPGTCTNSQFGGTSWNGAHPNIEVDAVAAGDPFQIGYVANLNVGDSFVDLTNDGATGGNICVNVYGFDNNEEMLSCCACAVTPNGLASLSIQSVLNNNTLTGKNPGSGVIKLLASTAPGGAAPTNAASCDAATPTGGTLLPGMQAWSTTLHASGAAGFAPTETPLALGTLSTAELNHLTSFCSFIQTIGSGSGICPGCKTGGQ